jgi:hypothetical protein
VLVLVADRRDLKLATTPSPAQALTFHDPPHGAVRDLNVLAVQLLPNFLRTITPAQLD